MNQQEEFLLKWNDHHNSFFNILQDLCHQELLTDVTLACGGQVFETHKLMLCVCSTFFRTLLTKRPDKHPIVFLKDVDPKHMEQLLQYMYNGEINVLQEDLGPLIETARSLQIKGLADAPASKPANPPPPPLQSSKLHQSLLNSTKAKNHKKPSSVPTAQPPPSLKVGGAIPSAAAYSNEDEIKIDGNEIWSEADAEDMGSPGDYQGDQEMYNAGEQELQDDQYMQTYSPKVGGQRQATTTPPPSMPLTRPCEYCGKTFVSPSKLRQHQLIHSGYKPFVCPVCQQSFNVISNLRRHTKTKHANTTNA